MLHWSKVLDIAFLIVGLGIGFSSLISNNDLNNHSAAISAVKGVSITCTIFISLYAWIDSIWSKHYAMTRYDRLGLLKKQENAAGLATNNNDGDPTINNTAE